VTSIDITGGRLVVTMRGLDRLWCLRSRIVVPLTAVRGATADPGITREPVGFRAPGTHLPGKLIAGTFHRDGRRTFWNLRNTQQPVVIELEGQHFTRLVLGVDDARATAERIERSLSRR
jgi:hypothetical protein